MVNTYPSRSSRPWEWSVSIRSGSDNPLATVTVTTGDEKTPSSVCTTASRVCGPSATVVVSQGVVHPSVALESVATSTPSTRNTTSSMS